MRSVTNHVSALLGYWDKDLVCRFANNTYSNWFGKTPGEMINKITMAQLVGAEVFDKILPNVQAALRGEPQTFEREIPFQSHEGIRFTLANYIPDVVDGKVLGFFVHIADISGIKVLERELLKSNETIKEQNKRLINFANIVTHNLKSYANNFKQILELLLQAESEAEKNEMLAFLKDISKEFSLTIDHLTEIADTQNNSKPRLEQVNLYEYFQRAVETLSIEMRSTNAVVHNKVDPQLTLVSNPAYLDSIILNLLSNSIKYHQPGRPAIIELDASKQGDEVAILVRDNGRGIDLEKNRDSLFGMYKTFHGNKDAKGVGLFLVRSQVEALGGRIEVESEVNTGTTFTLIFKL